MSHRRTYDGRPGITAEYFARRDAVAGRCDGRQRRLTVEEIRELVRDELLAILEEAKQA